MKFLANSVKANKKKNVPVECLLNNFIDEDFQSSYKALNLTDSLFLNSKFTILNNFITPSGMKSHLKSVIGAMVTATLHVCRFFYFSRTFKRFVSSNVIPSIMCMTEIGYILATVLIYIVNMTQSMNNTLLMIKIQKALRVINSEKHNIMKHHKLWNWINIIIIMCIYGGYALVSIAGALKLGQGLYSLTSILISLPDIIFDVSIIYVIRTVDLIGKILAAWHVKLATNMRTELVVIQEETENGTTTKLMFEAYMNLMESFRLCKSIFQFAIFFQVFQTFFQILLTLQVIIEFGSFGFEDKNNILVIGSRIVSTLYLSKNVVLLVNLSVACTQFYKQVGTAEETCMQVLDSTHNRDVSRLCKNVLRYNRASFRKLSSYGVFTVDASLPLRLLAAVLSYTVVLLQFAFLSG